MSAQVSDLFLSKKPKEVTSYQNLKQNLCQNKVFSSVIEKYEVLN